MNNTDQELRFAPVSSRILFEDNHLIAVNKLPGELVQSDQTGDVSLDQALKEYIKVKYHKPGAVFLGIIHRIDRPVSGVVLYARTSKALSRMNEKFREGIIRKIYWAVTENLPPEEEGVLEHYLIRNRKQNKSYAGKRPAKHGKPGRLHYRLTGRSQRYYYLEIDLLSGRHHQIRAQLASEGCVIKGDLKYGASRSNKDGGIHLHARALKFEHPVTREELLILADPPADPFWDNFVPGGFI